MNDDNSTKPSTYTGYISGHSDVVMWTIPEFFSLDKAEGQYIESPPFLLECCQWRLRMYPKGDGGNMPVYLYHSYPEFTPKMATFNLGLKKENGFVEEKESCCFISEEEVFWPNFWDIEDLHKRRSEFAPSGALTIACRMRREAANSAKKDTQRMVLLELEALSSDFKNLLSNDKNCDVTLCVQGKEFRVHKGVLSARSSVFHNMFEQDTAEAKSGVFRIPDSYGESFGNFLSFLYTGRIELTSFSMASRLYVTADKYRVQQLKSLCANYLRQNLTVETVCDIIVMADQFSDHQLQSTGHDFFSRNREKIFLTSKWETLKNNSSFAAWANLA